MLIFLAACGSQSSNPIENYTPSKPEDSLDELIATWEAETTEQPIEAKTDLPPISTFTHTPTNLPLTPTATPAPDAWQQAPIAPAGLSQRAIDIYLRGLELGNTANVFSKVGDCGGTPSWFLGSFDLDPKYYSLGEFQHLSGVIEHYSGSYKRTSLTVSPGFNTSSVFASLWADPKECLAGEGPLECEYRQNNPSVALIMLGTNDYLKPDEFENAMRRVIEFTVERGIVPILASKPDNLEGDNSINQLIYKLSLEYELPFWNLWAATQPLQNGGLQEDGAHLTWAPNFFDDPNAMRSGWPWRNLSALMALDAVWKQLPNQ